MKNKRKFQSVLFEFFTLSQQCGMGKADYEAAFERLDADDQLTIEALCLELEEKVDHKGFGKMCQLELLAKLGMWLSDNPAYAGPPQSPRQRGEALLGESPLQAYLRENGCRFMADYGSKDQSCVSFVTKDAEGKIVVLGCSFDEDVVKLVYRKAMEPYAWTDEDEAALNDAVDRFRDSLAWRKDAHYPIHLDRKDIIFDEMRKIDPEVLAYFQKQSEETYPKLIGDFSTFRRKRE